MEFNIKLSKKAQYLGKIQLTLISFSGVRGSNLPKNDQKLRIF